MASHSDSTPQEVTPEQLLDEIRQIKVADFVLSAVTTLAQLAYAKLEPSTRDLDQAKLAIESLKALVPTLEGAVAAQTVSDFNQVVANLQLAYVAALNQTPQAEPAQEEAPPAEEEAPPGEGEAPPAAEEAPPAEEEAPSAEEEAPPGEGEAPPAAEEARPPAEEAPPADEDDAARDG